MGSALGSQATRCGAESPAPRIMAAYVCKSCEIEGQDLEVSPGQVFCWNCEGEAMITARIVAKGT